MILIKEFKEMIRDKANVFFILLFPSLMVFLLGNLLTRLDSSESPVGTIRAQYVVETTDPAGKAAVQSFLSSLREAGGIALEEAADLETAKSLAASDDIAAAVVFRQPLAVEIYEGSDTIQNQALQAVFTAFSKTAGAVSAVSAVAPEKLPALGTGQEGGTLVRQKDLGVNRTMLDYYAVAMTVMILFMGGMGAAMAFQEERRNHTLERLMLSPKNKAVIYIQKVLGTVPQVFLQVVTVMLASTLLFGAHYAARWQDNLLLFAMFFTCGLAVIGVCAIVGVLVKVNAMVLLMPVFWVMMFLSGTFSKEVYVEGITNCSPLYLIQNAAFDLTVFGRGGKAAAVLFISLAVFLASLAAGALLFRRREARI